MAGRYDFQFTPLAVEDLDSTLDYIRTKLGNPTAAETLLESVGDALEKSRDFPFAYPDCRYYFIDDKTYRHIVIGNYILFFRVKEETHTIEILRFLFSRMDYSKIQIYEQ